MNFEGQPQPNPYEQKPKPPEEQDIIPAPPFVEGPGPKAPGFIEPPKIDMYQGAPKPRFEIPDEEFSATPEKGPESEVIGPTSKVETADIPIGNLGLEFDAHPKPETEPVLPADYLENDPRYKDLLRQASIDYLQNEDGEWFRREGYTVSAKGEVIGPKGVEAPTTLLGGPGFTKATEQAAKRFQEQYAIDGHLYAAREKARIYNDPTIDPAYKKVEQEITKRVNEQIHAMRMGGSNLSFDDVMAMQQSYGETVGKELWGNFVRDYPQKAMAYGKENSLIEGALNAPRQAQEKPPETPPKKAEASAAEVPPKAPEAPKVEVKTEPPAPTEKAPEPAPLSAEQEYLINKNYDEAYVRTLSPEQVEGLFNGFASPAPETAPKVEQKHVEPPPDLPTVEEGEEKNIQESGEMVPETSEAVPPGIEQQQEQAPSPEELAEEKKSLVETFRQKLGIDNIIDSVKIGFNGFIANWYEKKIDTRRKSVNALQSKVQNLENDAAHLDKQLKVFRADGNINEKTLLKIEKEKQKTEKTLAEVKRTLVEEQSRLERLNINKETFVQLRNESCRTYIDRVKEELRPFEENISELNSTREQLSKEIAADRKMLSDRREEISKIQARNEREQFPSVRKANREMIKRIEKESKLFEKEIHDREKHLNKIAKDLNKAQTRARPFQYKRDELESIMKKGVDAVPPKINEVPQTGSASESAPATPEKAPVNPEHEEAYSPEELITSWNAINGSKLLINPETFKKSLSVEGRPIKKTVSVHEFYSDVQIYALQHGDSERMQGMPDMKKAARKKSKFWKLLFGLTSAKMGRKRLLENVKQARNKPPVIPQPSLQNN